MPTGRTQSTSRAILASTTSPRGRLMDGPRGIPIGRLDLTSTVCLNGIDVALRRELVASQGVERYSNASATLISSPAPLKDPTVQLLPRLAAVASLFLVGQCLASAAEKQRQLWVTNSAGKDV